MCLVFIKLINMVLDLQLCIICPIGNCAILIEATQSTYFLKKVGRNKVMPKKWDWDSELQNS